MLIKLSDVRKYSHTETLMKVKTEVVLVSFLGATSFSSRQTWSFLLISTLGDQIPSVHLFTMFLVIEITHVGECSIFCHGPS